jgi:hypothetical protein
MASNDNTEANEHTGVDAEAYRTNALNVLLDQFKHLTTLSAGSLVLIATFLKDIFPRSDNGDLTMNLGLKLCIAASFVLLGISLISSVFFMVRFANKITSRTSPESLEAFLDSGPTIYSQAVSLLSFLAGIISFGVAVLINLFN